MKIYIHIHIYYNAFMRHSLCLQGRTGQVKQRKPREGEGLRELGWEVVQRAQAGGTGIAPKDIKRCHTLNMNCALYLTKMLLPS